jgi:hypothetical protein
MTRTANTLVKVAERASIWRRGRCVTAGETVRVSAADARHLERRGLAVRV